MSKKIKYIFALILFLVAFLAVGEMCCERLFSFQYQFAETSVYLQIGQKQSDLCADIAASAAQHHVEVFAVQSEGGTNNQDLLTIYGTKGAATMLAKTCDLRAGKYTSFFCDPICVSFASISELPEDSNGILLYVDGNWDDVCAFKTALVNDYAGKYPTKGNSDSDRYLFFGMWLVVFLVLLMFTVFEIYDFEKEKTILIVNGENIFVLMLKKIAADVLILSIAFAAARAISACFCHSGYHFSRSILCFLLFLMCNSVCYLFMLRFDVKKGFSNAIADKTVSTFLGMTKAVICICVIIGCAIVMYALKECISFFRQDSFFRNHTDLNYISFVGTQNDISADGLVAYSDHYYALCDQFYQEHLQDAVICELFADVSGYRIMNMNSAALQLVQEDVQLSEPDAELTRLIQEQPQAILIPKTLPEQVRSELMRWNFTGEANAVIEYEKFHAVCIGSDRNYLSSYETEPIVFLNNNSQYSPLNVLYRVTAEETEAFLAQHADAPENWKYFSTSAAELYETYREKIQKMAMVETVLMIVLVFLTILTIISMTRLYITSHKMELAVRYCLGDPFGKFLSAPIGINAVILLVSVGCAAIISAVLDMGVSRNLLYGFLLIALTDLLTVIILYRRFFRKSIIQIVKGRAL